jgi:hypothetical protein
MGRFEKNGQAKTGMDSEEFHESMIEAGVVECWKCGQRLGDGNNGQTMNVCIECLGYFCNNHIERHDKCSEGR